MAHHVPAGGDWLQLTVLPPCTRAQTLVNVPEVAFPTPELPDAAETRDILLPNQAQPVNRNREGHENCMRNV